MLEKLDLDDDGKLPIAMFADPVLTFSCVCVFVRVCALSSPQLVLARYNEGEDDQDVLPDSGKTPKNCPPRSQCAVCGACVDLFTEGQLFIRIVSVPPC